MAPGFLAAGWTRRAEARWIEQEPAPQATQHAHRFQIGEELVGASLGVGGLTLAGLGLFRSHNAWMTAGGLTLADLGVALFVAGRVNASFVRDLAAVDLAPTVDASGHLGFLAGYSGAF